MNNYPFYASNENLQTYQNSVELIIQAPQRAREEDISLYKSQSRETSPDCQASSGITTGRVETSTASIDHSQKEEIVDLKDNRYTGNNKELLAITVYKSTEGEMTFGDETSPGQAKQVPIDELERKASSTEASVIKPE